MVIGILAGQPAWRGLAIGVQDVELSALVLRTSGQYKDLLGVGTPSHYGCNGFVRAKFSTLD